MARSEKAKSPFYSKSHSIVCCRENLSLSDLPSTPDLLPPSLNWESARFSLETLPTACKGTPKYVNADLSPPAPDPRCDARFQKFQVREPFLSGALKKT